MSQKSYLSVSESCGSLVQIKELEKVFNRSTDLLRSKLGPGLRLRIREGPVSAPKICVGHAFREAVLMQTNCVKNLGSSKLKK